MLDGIVVAFVEKLVAKRRRRSGYRKIEELENPDPKNSVYSIRYIPYPATAGSARNNAKERGKKKRNEEKWIGPEGETIYPNPGN